MFLNYVMTWRDPILNLADALGQPNETCRSKFHSEPLRISTQRALANLHMLFGCEMVHLGKPYSNVKLEQYLILERSL